MNILITGASGSGTTTLGNYVADKLGWNAVDTDDYFWLPTDPPYTDRRDPSQRQTLFINELATAPDNVVSGSLYGWGDEIENGFDAIAFLYLPAEIRLQRLERREIERYGAANPEFLSWAASYDHNPTDGRSLEKHNRWLAQRSCPILRLEGDLTVEQRFQSLSTFIMRDCV